MDQATADRRGVVDVMRDALLDAVKWLDMAHDVADYPNSYFMLMEEATRCMNRAEKIRKGAN